jgi:RimJ/RimL family protein N-acetyltransferase
MTTTAIISSERLDLIPMTLAFLEAALRGESARAEAILGLSIPSEWFQEQALMQLRLAELQANPALQPWLLRAIGLRSRRLMLGYIGFHTQPGPAYLHDLAPGGVEYGYTIFASFRRQGYAREACAALMQWAVQEYGVTRFVVSIRPDNIPSRRLADGFGFKRIGSCIDDEDGLEDIYELRY